MSKIGKTQSPAPRSARLVLFCIPLFSLVWQGCGNNSGVSERASKKEIGSVAVVVAKATQKDLPINVQAVGTVEAYSTVTVKSQVSGELIQVCFREGDFVKKGEELFKIDARTYEAQLNQTQANLAKDESTLAQVEANLARDLAQQKYAQAEAARYASLLEKKLVSREQAEQMSANADASSAAVRADQAAIQSARAGVEATKAAVANARVLLGYTSILSPLDGRTGNLDVKQGNVISLNSVLTTINQVEPIYVTFSVPESQLRGVKLGQRVLVSSQTDSIQPETGRLSFIDNAVDAATGTIRVKAVFPNAGHKLWPGEFVRTVLRLDTKPNALVIPNQAVQTGQEGSFVFLVKSDETVQLRPVITGLRVEQDVVIEKGLQPGDIVVTEGQLRLTSGTRVRFTHP